jgi:20S proteasome alpha/beta subunit
MIVCAADLMQSAGDLQYEHQQSKYYPFSPAITALVAGDSMAQVAICERARLRLPQQGPSSVEEVANLYADEYQKYRRTIGETLYLRPLGLDLDSFIARQAEMSPSIANDITNKLILNDLDASALIVGRDSTGHHIYVVHDPGEVFYCNGIGFAAIGSGRRHAEAQFMLAGYARYFSIERALLLAYRAKRRAEVSPGVGTTTKMFVVTDKFSELIDDVHNKVQSIHQAIETDIVQVEKAAERDASKFIADFLRSKLVADGHMAPQLTLEQWAGTADNQTVTSPQEQPCPKDPEENAAPPT